MSTVQENTKDTCQAPPAHEMHFIALLSPFLMSDVPAGTLAAVPTRWKGCEDPVLCNHVTVALLRCKQQSQTDLPTAKCFSCVLDTHSPGTAVPAEGTAGTDPLALCWGVPTAELSTRAAWGCTLVSRTVSALSSASMQFKV